MGDLAKSFSSVLPREKSGPRTGARFAFQAHVSLAKILDLHFTANDYCAVFDHYDDLVFLDSSTAPAEMRFFQIKGKEPGAWTMASLCKPEGVSPQTTVGKLYHHTVGFGPAVKECTFVSNAPFSFDLAIGRKSNGDHLAIAYADLDATEQGRIDVALTLDFPAPRTPLEGTVLRFERTRVPAVDYRVYLKGRFIEAVPLASASAIEALYLTLITDITTKANDTRHLANLADLVQYKAITKTEVALAIATAKSRTSVLDGLSLVAEEMAAAGKATGDRIRLQSALIAFVHSRSMRESRVEPLVKDASAAAKSLAQTIQAGPGILSAATLIRGQLSASINAQFPEIELQAAAVTLAYEVLHG